MRIASVRLLSVDLLDCGSSGSGTELSIDEDSCGEADFALECLGLEFVVEGGCRHRHARGKVKWGDHPELMLIISPRAEEIHIHECHANAGETM